MGLSEKDITCILYVQRVKYKNGATKCLGGIAFQWKSWRREFIFSDFAWLKIVMVSPGTHLVKNIESQSRNNESQIKKKYIYIYEFVIEYA